MSVNNTDHLCDALLDLSQEEIETVTDEAIRKLVGSYAAILTNKDSDKIKEYLMESVHNNWDGWEPDQLMAAMPLLRDMVLYVTAD